MVAGPSPGTLRRSLSRLLTPTSSMSRRLLSELARDFKVARVTMERLVKLGLGLDTV